VCDVSVMCVCDVCGVVWCVWCVSVVCIQENSQHFYLLEILGGNGVTSVCPYSAIHTHTHTQVCALCHNNNSTCNFIVVVLVACEHMLSATHPADLQIFSYCVYVGVVTQHIVPGMFQLRPTVTSFYCAKLEDWHAAILRAQVRTIALC